VTKSVSECKRPTYDTSACLAIGLAAHSFRPAPGSWRATARVRDDGIAIAAIGARVRVKAKA
jgi:hypothetical protein